VKAISAASDGTVTPDPWRLRAEVRSDYPHQVPAGIPTKYAVSHRHAKAVEALLSSPDNERTEYKPTDNAVVVGTGD
jgi:hypothetical protein